MARTCNRTTVITTSKKSFDAVSRLKEGESITIGCPNDVVSSARGNQDSIHHSIRRISLIRRQMNGGYRRVKVRYEQGHELDCVLAGRVIGNEDDCAFKVSVKRGL